MLMRVFRKFDDKFYCQDENKNEIGKINRILTYEVTWSKDKETAT